MSTGRRCLVVGSSDGIGLALARLLVEMHGGTIAADSPGAGAGATFTILLPSPAAVLARERNLRPVAK